MDRDSIVGPHLVEFVDGRAKQRRKWQIVLARAALGDGVDLGLSPVDHIVDVARVDGVPELNDLGASLDEPPQDRPLAHDHRVVAGVGGGGNAGDERVEVGRAADAGDLTPLRELGSDGHRIGWLASAGLQRLSSVSTFAGGTTPPRRSSLSST